MFHRLPTRLILFTLLAPSAAPPNLAAPPAADKRREVQELQMQRMRQSLLRAIPLARF